jgi:hypothetical protein
MAASIMPGPWWLKPLWSLRQHVLVNRMLSDATGSRHRRSRACWSHLTCWIIIETLTIANAS